MTFSFLYIDALNESKNRQDSIAEQAVEITKLNNSNEELSSQVENMSSKLSLAEAQLISAQSDLEVLKQNKVAYLGQYQITYYCACKQCCGKENGITASGEIVQEGVTVAADTSILPMGSKIYIEGIGWRTVQDRGGAIKGNKLDIYVPSHDSPMPYNKQKLNVWVVLEDV